MAFQLSHPLLSRRFTPQTHVDSQGRTSLRVSLTGTLTIRHPGRLVLAAVAKYHIRIAGDPGRLAGDDGPLGGGGGPVRPGGGGGTHKPVVSEERSFALTLHLVAPDGTEFRASQITASDLDRFRDGRGDLLNPWRYRLVGQSEAIPLELIGATLSNPRGSASLKLVETIPSQSAPPLVPSTVVAARRSFTFDLFRVGGFVAEASPSWRGAMRLRDPDGTIVAQTTSTRLAFEVGPSDLGRSRGPRGQVRRWTLETEPVGPVATPARIQATVVGRGRFATPALRRRLEALLGPRGSFVRVFGENQGSRTRVRIEVSDVVSAETIDMHGLLDDALRSAPQDPGVDRNDFRAGVPFTLFSRSRKLAKGLELDLGGIRVGAIDVGVGAGRQLGASTPAVRLSVEVVGSVRIRFGALTLASARARGGRLDIEIGARLDPDGTPRLVGKVPRSPFDIDIDAAGKAALLLTLGLGGLVAGMSITEYVEHEINEMFVEEIDKLVSPPDLAPRFLMMLFGVHLTYLPLDVQGDELVFDHIAPVEPEPVPHLGYRGAIGREVTLQEGRAPRFDPPQLGDTWSAENLLEKIDHVVVVMMENRSFDHVLGYRARAPLGEDTDGLTDEVIAAIEQTAPTPPSRPGDPPLGSFDVRPLRDAGFAPNAAGRMTRLPRPVGHSFVDVAEQLGTRIDGPGGPLNGPQGFVENFRRELGDPQGVVPNDVLGFYGAEDLPFYAYLAEHYGYCDTYFSSHPGPTLPNRMYSLTGDVQRDRHGLPIIENNDSDNFVLSRTPTIYDLLVRYGHGFRVYESFPSVTMLRMFARYATNDVDIVPLDRLEADVARGDLPALTAIEPQMHAHPQDDDHAVADMHRGQLFVKRVYDALTSNPALWERTLLVVTYDEHGGLYDHVVPPVADVFGAGRPISTSTTTTTTGGVLKKAQVPLGGARVPARAGGVVLEDRVGRLPVDKTRGNPVLTPVSETRLVTVPYGLRVPTFVISPWVSPGRGPRLVLDHCSILKTVLARFLGRERPFMSDRVSASHSFDAWLTEPAPRDVPPFTGDLPELPLDVRATTAGSATRIVTPPLSRRDMKRGSVDYHDLTGRWARQLGR